MSLSVSSRRFSDAFVASVAPPPGFSPLPAAQIGGLLGSFMSLLRPQQAGVLWSAHHYLSSVTLEDPRILESVGNLASRLDKQEEMPPMAELTVSTLGLVWNTALPQIIAGTPAAEAPLGGPPPSSFEKVATPKPPPARVPRRSLSGTSFAAVRPPQVEAALPPETPAVTTGAAVVEDEAASRHLFPSFWWDLNRDTRLDLKSRALGRTGAVAVLKEDETEHARFLGEVMEQWAVALRDLLRRGTDEGASAESLQKETRCLLERMSDLLDRMRERRRGDEALASLFWDHVGERPELRQALSRLSAREIQTRLDEASQKAVAGMRHAVDRGVLEHYLLPLFPKDPNEAPLEVSDEEGHGAGLGAAFQKGVEHLPYTDLRTLSEDHRRHLLDVRLALRAVAERLRAGEDSAVIRAFTDAIQLEFTRLPVVVSLIRRDYEPETPPAS